MEDSWPWLQMPHGTLSSTSIRVNQFVICMVTRMMDFHNPKSSGASRVSTSWEIPKTKLRCVSGTLDRVDVGEAVLKHLGLKVPKNFLDVARNQNDYPVGA